MAALKIVGNLGVSLVDTVSNVFTGEKPLLPAEPSMAPEQEGSGKEQNNENDDDAGESGDQESSGHGRNLRYVFYD